MQITGRTPDGTLVVGGGFLLYNERGVPIVEIVRSLDDAGFLLDWCSFCADALRKGWKLGKAYTVLREGVEEVYDRRWVEAWDRKMRAWCHLRASGG